MLELESENLESLFVSSLHSARGIIWIFIEISEGTHLSPLCNEMLER